MFKKWQNVCKTFWTWSFYFLVELIFKYKYVKNNKASWNNVFNVFIWTKSILSNYFLCLKKSSLSSSGFVDFAELPSSSLFFPVPVEDLFESVNDREIRQVFEGQTQIHLEIKQLHRQLAMILDEQRRYVALITEEVTKKGTAVESGQVRHGGRWSDAGRGTGFLSVQPLPPPPPPLSSSSWMQPVSSSWAPSCRLSRKSSKAWASWGERQRSLTWDSLLVFPEKTCFCFDFFFPTNVKMDVLRKTSEIPAVKPRK